MSSPKKVKSDFQQSDTSRADAGHLQVIDFTRKSCWTDLQLKVENKDLYVPKSHLALISPVFRLMFESDFKEKNLDVLPLPGKRYEDVLTFLKCTHPGALVKVTYAIVLKVLPLAHEYQVQWLLDDCKNAIIMEVNASKSSYPYAYDDSAAAKLCCNICIVAEKYGLGSVISKVIERLSSVSYNVYKNLTEFKQISTNVRYMIVCGRLGSIEKS